MADQTQVDVARLGSAAWDQWRREHPNAIPDLRGADLRQVQLGEANLEGAHLDGADLRWSHLDLAVLCEAKLRQCPMTRARLRATQAQGADLSHADLTEARLEQAHLNQTRLHRTCLSQAHLERTDLRGAILTQATLARTSLRGADLSDVILDTALLAETNLEEVDFTHVRVRHPLGGEAEGMLRLMRCRSPAWCNGSVRDGHVTSLEGRILPALLAEMCPQLEHLESLQLGDPHKFDSRLPRLEALPPEIGQLTRLEAL